MAAPVNASFQFRIECDLPEIPLPFLSLFFDFLFDFSFPPVFNFNFALVIKCPEIPTDFLDDLKDKMTLTVAQPVNLTSLSKYTDLSRYSQSYGGEGTFDFDPPEGSGHWDYIAY